MSMYIWQWGPKHVGPGGPGHGGRAPQARSGTPTGTAEIHGNGSGTARVMSGFDIEITNLQRHQSKAEAGADPTPRPHAGTHPPIHPSTSPPTGGPDRPGVVANFLGGVQYSRLQSCSHRSAERVQEHYGVSHMSRDPLYDFYNRIGEVRMLTFPYAILAQ